MIRKDTENDLEGYKHIIDKIHEINLFDNIKNKLNTTKFNFTQSKQTFEHIFCNESVYGNLNLITVFGLVKL